MSDTLNPKIIAQVIEIQEAEVKSKELHEKLNVKMKEIEKAKAEHTKLFNEAGLLDSQITRMYDALRNLFLGGR